MKNKTLNQTIDLIADLSEAVLDTLINNQILQNIPVLGTAVKLARTGSSISDRIFLLKIQKFLDAFEPDSSEEVQRFAQELESGDVDASRTAGTLLLVIDQIDDLAKAPIIAVIFRALLQRDIDKSEFRRMVAAVNAALVDDLLEVIDLGVEPNGSLDGHSDLINALRHTGLTDDPKMTIAYGDADLKDAVTPLGKNFNRIMSTSEDATNEQSAG